MFGLRPKPNKTVQAWSLCTRHIVIIDDAWHDIVDLRHNVETRIATISLRKRPLPGEPEGVVFQKVLGCCADVEVVVV